MWPADIDPRPASCWRVDNEQAPVSPTVSTTVCPVASPTASPTVAPPKVETETVVKDKLAPLYRVICHDDPITTMDFVVGVLRSVFRLTPQRAVEIMLGVDQTGAALVGRYPRSLAERRVTKAQAMARSEGFPLTFSIEEDV